MDARELRMGNLVKSLGWCEDSGGNIVADPEMDSIEPATLKIMMAIANGDSITKYQPIPLNSEWLVKAGFIDPVKNGCGYRLSINTSDELCFYVLQNELRYQTKGSGFTRDFNIKYIHQLQNLYYALTGEELTFKQ